MANENAYKDANDVSSLLAVDDDTGETRRLLTDADGNLLVAGSIEGGITGPGSSTDNAVVRWDGTTGETVQNSVVVIGDTGNVTGLGTLNTLTLPSSNFVGVSDSQALTNKSVNGLTITSTTGTLTIASGKTLSVSNTLTFTGTDSTSFAFPSSSDTVVTLGATQTLTNKTLTSPTLTTPSLGVATATSINGLTITSSTGTLTITNGKTLSVSNSLTFAGTDGNTLTFPSGSDTVVTLTASQTLTNKTLTTPVIASISNGGTVTIPSGADTLAAIAATQTLTNKRITKRTGTVASSATPTINTDNVDFYSITALAAAITSFTTNLSGTPTDAQTLWIAITDDGTPRTIAWGASFESSGTVTLPTTTVASTRLDVGLVWNAATSKWRCVATA